MTPFRSRPARIAALVVRMLLGIFFIVSAIAKLNDIDRFEIYIFSFNLLTLNLSFLLARVVIVCEMLVGIGLLSNICKRLVDTCTLLLLVAFTLFLGYATLIGRQESCQCMGSLLEFNPMQSILKNALLIILLLFAMGSHPWKWQPRWFVWLPVVLAPWVIVFVISAPDNWLFGESEELFNSEELTAAMMPEGTLHDIHLDKGRHVVAFLTPGCQFCKMADEKLAHICMRNDLDSVGFIYLSPTADSTVAPLTVDSTTFSRPCLLIPTLSFALITYGQRPLILMMDEGNVTGTCHYRNINEEQITAFLRNKQ